MPAAVKQQIIARLMQLAESLKTAGTVREIKRATSLYLLVKTVPSLHVVIGAEDTLEGEEDARGYACEFDVFFKFTVEHGSDPYGACDDLVAAAQTLLETDLQLGQLVRWMRYRSDDPFTSDETAPRGGTVLTYRVQYRRQRGKPEAAY